MDIFQSVNCTNTRHGYMSEYEKKKPKSLLPVKFFSPLQLTGCSRNYRSVTTPVSCFRRNNIFG